MKISKKYWLIISIIIFLLTGVILYFVVWGPSNPVKKLQKKGPFNFILITVDTLRADRIGCYGFPRVKTPTIDNFAQHGIKFEKCISQTPLTLPSHTSILTGTYPTFHGVRDNGGFLVPQELTTLAEVFKDAGYQTSAFVAAYVLDSKWGLNQGFDVYYDKFDLSKYKTISLGNVQRRGDEVIDEALAWLKDHQNQQFFTWIHLYDPHTPYDPPSPFKEEYPNHPYLGEIAFTDSQLARLWSFLEKNGLTEKTILVFASDHGESLGEHQEKTHGFFIYQEGVHVPLIFVLPEKELQGLTRSSVVNLVDIMPTVLELARLPQPREVQGQSLISIFTQERKEPGWAYSETYYPRFHYGWSELKGWQNQRYKLIMAPRLELYDLIEDPEESNNLIDSLPQLGRKLLAQLEEFVAKTSQGAYEIDYTHIDEETRQKLTALGYIGTFTRQQDLQGKKLGDPKDKIHIFNQLSEARETGLKGNFDRAIRLIKEIIRDDPEVIDAYFTLGNLYFKHQDFDRALEQFFIVLDKNPRDAFTIINIANCYIMKGEFERGEEFLKNKLKTIPPDSQVYLILGNIEFALKKYTEAEQAYRECLRLNPSSASAYTALGGIYVIQNKLNQAEESLCQAARLNSRLRNLHYNLAQLYEKKGELARAIEEYKLELENIPHNFRASFNLARLYRLLKNDREEEKYLKQTIESNPRFPLSYFYLARIYLNRGERYEEAIELVKKGLDLKPEKKNLPLGYFLLADLYNRLGDNGRSQHYAHLGEKIVREVKK
ncbi:MAG: sulfatase-like hydrolase/transferase [Candidatus Aminicenantes bacterium]|nr:sulfatase-like hydrolase/transferase [Candidatus Aminicenantes bacterium]